MSCGLGAIILVFMLVKYNVDTTTLQTELLHQEQGELLQKELAELKTRERELRSEISNLDTSSGKAMATIRAASNELARVQKSLAGIFSFRNC